MATNHELCVMAEDEEGSNDSIGMVYIDSESDEYPSFKEMPRVLEINGHSYHIED